MPQSQLDNALQSLDNIRAHLDNAGASLASIEADLRLLVKYPNRTDRAAILTEHDDLARALLTNIEDSVQDLCRVLRKAA